MGADVTGAPIDRPQPDIDALYRSHFGKVVGYFQGCGLSAAVAQDLAQDVFMQVWRAAGGFRGEAKVSTWMWQIARNLFVDHLRTKPDRMTPALADDGEPIDPDMLPSSFDERVEAQHDCIRRGFAAFHRDHPERAQVLYLAVIEGWRREELAEFLGRSVHAATEYLSQCRQKFRPYVEYCHGD